MRTFLSLLLFFIPASIFSQVTITGKVTDQDNNPVIGANISIKGTYDGTTSATDGSYKLKTKKAGKQTLVASYIGYTDFSKEFSIEGTSLTQDIRITEKPNEMNSVIVQAGTFGASDSKKAVKLSSIDILTTATSNGDIYGALQTMPGTASVGEDGGLFVRGGEGYETKTFMDGMMVHKPFTAKMPDLPSRGRFMPAMFSGTSFSTGGYSAEYGQAMSSALILTSNGVADEPITSIGILPFGGSLNKTIKNNKSSLSVSADYYNLATYNSVVKQNIDWQKDPRSFNSSYLYRQQLNSGTLVKSYTSYSKSGCGLFRDNIDKILSKEHITLDNDDVYSNTTVFGKMNNGWNYKTGVGYTYDNENINLDEKVVGKTEHDVQLKTAFSGNISERIKLNTGGEIWLKNMDFNYKSPSDSINFNTNFSNYTPAYFAETDIYLSNKITGRLGGRIEYTSLNKKVTVAPRASIAFQTGKFSQVSFASGIFYQTPENDYLMFSKNLNNTKAIHYILNYQYIKDDNTFRIESYYKDYTNLVKYDSLNAPNPESYNNNGYGYARGIDVFYRRNKGIGNNDFWVSLTYLDTKRNYKDYPELATPSYFPNLSMAVAYKKMLIPINTLLGITLVVNNGRHFHNPNKDCFMNDQTGIYKEISMSASYITKLFKQETIVHLSVSNVFGFNNTYGYNFSSRPGADGQYKAIALKPEAKRFVLLGVFISIK
jgi:hypothetical protein